MLELLENLSTILHYSDISAYFEIPLLSMEV